MSTDSNRWINTLPFINKESNKEKYKLDSNRWINTLPKKNDDILILTNTINSNSNSNSNSKSSSSKKYSLTIIGFVVGLILVSVIKNETRNLQKEISNLQTSIKTLKLDLYQTTLEQEVITSPENISRLAKEYLEFDLASYKKSQIKQLSKKTKIFAKDEEKNNKKTFKKKNIEQSNEVKLLITKKIAATKIELRKLQELYSTPEKLPGEIKLQVAKRIETKKNELQLLYSDPYSLFKSKKARNWAGLQVVKVFLGIPIVPGK